MGVKTFKSKKTRMQDQACEWMPSVVEDKELQELVDRGFLPCKELANWKSVHQQAFPSEDTGETIAYVSFFERGLGLPASRFLRGLLYFYNIELVHLNPNGIFHIALFVHMCEAFLGIDPHFQLFRYFFRLTPHPNSDDPNVCGGAGFQLRQSTKKHYFDVPMKDPDRKWHSQWFIIGNLAPQLPLRSGHKPVFTDTWNSSPNEQDSIHIKELVEKIANLKKQGLTAAGIAWSFIKRRIQPLQERSVPGYLYKGPEDPSRLKKEDLTNDEILERVRKFLVGVNFEPKTPPECSAPSEYIDLYRSPSPLPEHLTVDQTAEAEISGSKELISQRAKAAAHSISGLKRSVEEGRLQVQVPKKKRTVRKVKICHNQRSDNVWASEDNMSGDLPMTSATTSSGTARQLKPEASSPISISGAHSLSDPFLSSGMQIKASLQDLQGPSPDVSPLGSLCFELKQYKNISNAAVPPSSPSSAEAREHLTASVEIITSPSGDVSASEDKMPTKDEALTQTSVERSKQTLALLKQSNQLLSRAESAEAKLAEEQESYAKQEKDNLAAIAVLQEQVDSLKEKNKELLASLKERVQAEATIKEELTNSKNLHEHTEHQLDQALRRGKTLKDLLELEQKVCQSAGSRLDANRKQIRDLSTRLEKSIKEKEEIKVAAASILQLVSGLSENEVSMILEQVPGLIQVFRNLKEVIC